MKWLSALDQVDELDYLKLILLLAYARAQKYLKAHDE